MKHLVSYWETPQFTALEYDEQKDFAEHPEKAGHYSTLIKERTKFGKGFETKAPRKKKRKNAT